MSGPLLHCRLDRVDGLDVVLDVGTGEVEFGDRARPVAGEAFASLTAEGQPPPDGGVPLAEVALVLDPERAGAWQKALGSLLEIENRIDAETALSELAAHLHGRIRRWRATDAGFREAREQALGRVDPLLATLVRTWPDAVVSRDGARFPELRPSIARALPEADEEAWAAWRAREVEEILGEKGGMARLLGERFEFRAGQLDMAEAVARTIARDEHLMCEAGTGIGKSIAYLVPALLHGAREGERVVVSTHTHTLQSQLVGQDLPLLQRLGYPGRARRLLGRNNYLCRRQLMRAMAARPTDLAQARAQFALAIWASTSREGTREELVDHPWFARFWQSHFASIEPCSPHICHRDPPCFVVRARRDAREAHVVVVNHALLMMDVQGQQSLIGPAGALVVDEAHQLPDVATHALSVKLSASTVRVHENLTGDRDRPEGMRAVLGRFARADRDLEEAAREADGALEAFLRSYANWFEALEEHFRSRLGAHAVRPGQHRIHDAGEAFGPVRDLDARLSADARQLGTALAALLGRSGGGEADQPDLAAEREALANLLEAHDRLVEDIRFVQAVDDEDHVYWVEWGGESGLRAVVAAPLAVSRPLAEAWDGHYRSVVMTSATLAVEKDFMPFAEAVGFDQVARFTETLQVDSPFSAAEQSRIFSALNLPGPDDAELPELVSDIVAAIARSIVTKMLVLSTSYRLIDQVEPRLREALAGAERELFDRGRPVEPLVLVQRPSTSRDELVHRFRTARAAVLLATGSFWEGVDFPGEQLEILVVPRLPFPVPTDPVIEGRNERARRLGRDSFEAVSLVDAVLRLKQGVGRLLRTTEDRGVVLLLDRRLQTRSYGVRFVNSLPRLVQILPDHADMVPETLDFLRRGRG